ncbi:TonB-dependent siderophore receptor [Bradyrhizobium sp. Arg237L]|uniref:TonB-dependent siderophore receptor n=1 Tax=Bradyrhizobium sp. Arg237L TaxID=3003352 RepID=UPI00249F40E6|nr:TonB-dependent siderophore receptor [Bradyrhizobium sp. Arg237L]MDI4232431.1 TonB-dependent siderophore receptor [Bradyrhizobium sp. Arg237L]
MLALGALLLSGSPVDAQTAGQSGASPLPPVTVDAPTRPQRAAPQRRAAASRSGASQRRDRQAANPSAQSQSRPATVSTAERVNAGTNGFVASRASGATKTDAPIMSTPGSVAVITRSEMDVRQAQSIRDLLRYAPGIYFSNDTDFRYQQANARGFAVEQYLDGLRLQGGPFGAPRIDPYLLERAELITGPASILYGAASPGGILNLVSKRPTENPFGEVQLQTGTFDRIQGAFDVGGPVDKEKTLLYRVTGIGLSANTQVDNIGEEKYAIAPAWTWRPDIDTTITFLTSYRQDPKGGAFALLPIQGTLVPGTYGQIPRNFFAGDFNYESLKYKQATIGYEFEHRFDDIFTVRQNVRYLHNELNYIEVQPSAFTTTGAGPTLRLADGRTIRRNYFSTNENLNTFAADNQLQAKFNMGSLQHTVLAGFDYQRFDFNNLARFAPTNTLDIVAPNYTQNIAVPTSAFQNLDQHLEQRGVYVQDEAKLGKLTVLGGIRYDWAEGNTLNLGTRVLNNDEKSSGRIGAIYNFDVGVAPYVSYSTSFQPTSVGVLSNGQPYKPTTGEQVEVGVKYQPVGYNLIFTAAVYDLKQQNVVSAIAGPGIPPNSTAQVGEVTSRGFEGSVVGSPLPGLSLRGQYSYLDNRITAPLDVDYGKVLANTPMHTASLWANYVVQNGPAVGFGFGGGVRYMSDMYTTNANNLTVPTIVANSPLLANIIPASTTFDAALSYDFGMRFNELKGLSAALNVNNVFDRSYVSLCTAGGCRWAVGRTVLATMTYRW